MGTSRIPSPAEVSLAARVLVLKTLLRRLYELAVRSSPLGFAMPEDIRLMDAVGKALEKRDIAKPEPAKPVALAETLDDPSMPLAPCPKCGAWVEDHDGFGVLAHIKPAYADGCGHCSHPSRDGDGHGGWICGICARRDFPPLAADHPVVARGMICPLCEKRFVGGDKTTLVTTPGGKRYGRDVESDVVHVNCADALPPRRKAAKWSRIGADWEVVDGTPCLAVTPPEGPAFMLRLRDADAFRGFMCSVMEAACKAFPEIAAENEFVNGPDPNPERKV